MDGRRLRRWSAPAVAAALVVSLPVADAIQGAGAAVPDVGSPAAAGRVELLDRRTEHSRTFREADGTNVTTFSAAPLNFRAASGRWQPIDVTLERQADGSLRTAAGDVDVSLPSRADGRVVVSEAGRTLGFTLLGAAAADVEAAGGTARYEETLPDVEVAYETQANGLKETLVLSSPDAPAAYAYALDMPGLTASPTRSGDVVVRDAGGTERFRIAAPWMRDASGALSSSSPATICASRSDAPAWSTSS